MTKKIAKMSRQQWTATCLTCGMELGIGYNGQFIEAVAKLHKQGSMVIDRHGTHIRGGDNSHEIIVGYAIGDVPQVPRPKVEGMAMALELTKEHFESSSEHTPEYLAWHRIFKREFTKFLQEHGCGEIKIGKPNHFDMSGFFTTSKVVIYYFSISDLRWSKGDMLIRTAEHYKDYTGGTNQSISLDNTERFHDEFARVIGLNK